MKKFILLHLQSNNSTVAVNIDNIQLVIKDTWETDENKPSNKPAQMYTCIYFSNNERIRRIFVNESVERVYNMITNANKN